MVEAILFDWGDTLMHWAWEPELLAAGHRAGLDAVGRDGLPEPELLGTLFQERLPQLSRPGVLEEIEYPSFVRDLFAYYGAELSDDELDRFLEAEHAAWNPARQLGGTTHALLDSLRAQGLKLALVSNAVDPPWLLHRDLEQLGVAQRLDVAVFSSEVGWRKPHPAIFERALAGLGVEPAEALFVGDDVVNDVGGAAALGMATVQALWFRADDRDEPEPDYQAFTQMDVLNIVRRLRDAA